jgi:hypothetical protein
MTSEIAELSRLLAAVKTYAPISEMPDGEFLAMAIRATGKGKESLTTTEWKMVNRANRKRLKDLRAAGATFDSATGKPL